MEVHLLFDILSFFIPGFFLKKVLGMPSYAYTTEVERYWYYSLLIIGFVFGAIFLGTLNVYISIGHFSVSKSILGAIFGGIAAVEIYKKVAHIKGSTGAYFVPSLALGIAIGRLGCFFAGLDDYTYGVATTRPWGVDFGDGVLRHPVQLYESLTMGGFFFYAWWMYKRDVARFEKTIFYLFVLFYASQRFVWECLKPYADVALGLNLFQWVCIGLILYAYYYLKKENYGAVFRKI